GPRRSRTRADLKPGRVLIHTSVSAGSPGSPLPAAGTIRAPASRAADRTVDVAGLHLTQCIGRPTSPRSSINFPAKGLAPGLGMGTRRSSSVRLRGRAWLSDRWDRSRFTSRGLQKYSAPWGQGAKNRFREGNTMLSKFYPNERVALFIDGANLHAAAR